MKIVFSFLLLMIFALTSKSEENILPGNSIFQIQTVWSTQDNKKVLLKDFRGKTTILSMVYLSCQFLCPTIISEVQELETKIDPKVREQTQVILVSFDPTKDTPQVMKSYAKKRKLNTQRWTFLTAKKDMDVRELAAALNFKYQKIEGGDFTHSFMIVVLDKNGVPIARVDSIDQDKQILIDAIRK